MKTKKLIITGVLGIFLSIVVIFAVGIFVIPMLHHEQILEYRAMDVVKQFELTYPDSGMVATSSGKLLEQHITFTNFKNARMASLDFTQGITGEHIVYKCEKIISMQESIEIFYFENPTVDTIKDNVCGSND